LGIKNMIGLKGKVVLVVAFILIGVVFGWFEYKRSIVLTEELQACEKQCKSTGKNPVLEPMGARSGASYVGSPPIPSRCTCQ
jgi:hypothetical protein